MPLDRSSDGRPSESRAATRQEDPSGHSVRGGYQYLRARYYDASTGAFLTRDPAQAITGSAYAYSYGSPTNIVDPSGLFGIPGTSWCVDIADDDCSSIAEQHPGAAQAAADISAGILDTVSGGNADWITERLGIDDQVRWGSGYVQGGRAVGYGVALFNPAAFLSSTTAGGVGNGVDTTLDCVQGRGGPKCGIDVAFAWGSVVLPAGVGRVARPLGQPGRQGFELLAAILGTTAQNASDTLRRYGYYC